MATRRTTFSLRLLLSTLLLALTSSVFAAAIAPIFSTQAGAIRGYDPVAYFTEHRAVKGKTQLVYRWNEADWHFSKAENLAAFKADPEKYAPQYGGYCAYGVAQGYTPETDPHAYQVLNGKLYLNLSKVVLKRWQQDIPGYVSEANQNWPQLQAGTYVEK
ncbi:MULTISPECIES: YHS domain-containing (seleno)protein [unclassified Undibacterium]|uniref:YHS domain-containing (seleno)protein n=1 Tax=unclassified Undibacterium TaxID=2630295 RepID=UPI002AC9301A|nr:MULTISPECIES: YHS domain-containing (seleno)protein [unclassified Undibacterium]MEB0137569.1 YHS domain-containing (seleno)protein [Undibacterium sp. CCC2.1]MEB0170570.1 YHS domain-containing (seleno)protein [Undibacterium sp. CCC1.1]MEB0174511.1 YHS domain-containing (seleno)protein [Undibacterium sp. CCC3.4]MEB0213692.1 YHS domain-containing (seleno)protein [Undibacterium sp. 5I2]WPX43857.1 YHS domain-containing (seleno)protein [Undibacterium sp. CCC3.4]